MNTYPLLLHLLLVLPCLSLAQEPFIFNYEQEFSDHIADVYEKNDSIIILQNRIYNFDLPGLFDYDSYADLVIIDQLGNVLST